MRTASRKTTMRSERYVGSRAIASSRGPYRAAEGLEPRRSDGPRAPHPTGVRRTPSAGPAPHRVGASGTDATADGARQRKPIRAWSTCLESPGRIGHTSFSVSSRIIRRTLIDAARSRAAQKRGGAPSVPQRLKSTGSPAGARIGSSGRALCTRRCAEPSSSAV
jgi:hypothetical protein